METSLYHASILGALLGDTLSLGPHWIYNQEKIKRLLSSSDGPVDPLIDSYHPNRKKGQLTHYGDQTLALLESVKQQKAYDHKDFTNRWYALWADYDGYVDGATKETLTNLNSKTSPTGSGSNDLAGASRIAPLLLTQPEEEEFVRFAREQTSLTHADLGVIDAAEYFARLTSRVLKGLTIPAAIESLSSFETTNLPVSKWRARFTSLLDQESNSALEKIGLTCHLPDAFPATLYLLEKHPDDLRTALIENALAGGDTAARGLLIGMVLGARLGMNNLPQEWLQALEAKTSVDAAFDNPNTSEKLRSERYTFPNQEGQELSGKLELPAGEPKGFAIFAHCFTCSKNASATSRISRELAKRGIAVLRFDFTGLGNSEGDFTNTNFSSNIEDLMNAAKRLEKTHRAPALLIGHSLGGAAVIATAGSLPSVKGVITIGAPADPAHVTHLLEDSIPEIERSGLAEISLAGRKFTIKKEFLDDLDQQRQVNRISSLNRSLLIFHSPTDKVVGIENAAQIYTSAKHPKSFISLDQADHMLSNSDDATYTAEMIAAWSNRLLNT